MRMEFLPPRAVIRHLRPFMVARLGLFPQVNMYGNSILLTQLGDFGLETLLANPEVSHGTSIFADL